MPNDTKAKGRGPGDGVRKRGSVWYVNWYDEDGVRREAPVSARTRPEAREQRARLIVQKREKRLGLWDGDPDMTVQQLYERYERANRHKGDWKTTAGWFRNHILPAIAHKRLRSVLASDVEELLALKGEGGLSPRSREHIRSKGRHLFNFGIKKERALTGVNPFSVAERVRVPDPEPRVLDPGLVQDVIDAVEPDWRNFFALALYTGLRSGELRALRAESVDRHHRWITVSRSGTRGETKSGRARFVPIPRAALLYLEDALELSAGRTWLFTDFLGRQLTRNIKPSVLLRRALEKLGLVVTWMGSCSHAGCSTTERGRKTPEPFRCPRCGLLGKVEPEFNIVFHDLRKTYETMVYEATGDALAAARIAGHSPEVAARHYIPANRKRLEAMADGLDFKAIATGLPPKPTDLKVLDTVSDVSGIKRPR